MARLREAQRSEPIGATPGAPPSRNPDTPLGLEWVRSPRVNRCAAGRRTDTLPRRRSVKHEWQVARLLRAITRIDLTTLSGDDTPGRGARLCAKARRPFARICSPRSAPRSERRSAGNLKRTWVSAETGIDGYDSEAGAGEELPRQPTHIKNIWISHGE